MPKLKRWLPFVISSCFLIEACAPSPPDVFVFENMQQRLSNDPVTGHLILTPSPTCEAKIGEPECGHGVSIVAGREVFVGEKAASLFNGKKWSELKAESVYVPSIESYAPLGSYIINACRKMGCNKQVDAFRIKLDSLNGLPGALSNR